MSHKRQFDKEEVTALVMEGHVPSKIARILRCGYTTIMVYLMEHNIDHKTYAQRPQRSKRVDMLITWDLKKGDWVKVRTYIQPMNGVKYYKESFGLITQVTPYFATYKIDGKGYNHSFSYMDALCKEIIFEKIENPHIAAQRDTPHMPAWGY